MIFADQSGSVVVFQWISWLQSEAGLHLGLNSGKLDVRIIHRRAAELHELVSLSRQEINR